MRTSLTSLIVAAGLLACASCTAPTARPDAGLDLSNQPEPVTVGQSYGLEMRLVAVQSEGGAVALALRRFQSIDTGIDPETTRRLQQSGLRVLAVPLDALTDAFASLRHTGPAQREWLGTMAFWTPIITGPELTDRYTRLDSGLVPFPPGRFRLLSRCWLVPNLDRARELGIARAALRLELVPQHLPAERRRLERLLEPSLENPVNEGQILDRLRLVCDLPEGHALVIVPEDPDVDWDDFSESSPQPRPQPTTPGPDPKVPPQIDALLPAGPAPEAESPPQPNPPAPAAPRFRSLGEQLLRRVGQVEQRLPDGNSIAVHRERSVIVVLTAHVPSQYKLVP
ncbi:MAG: hypothetical protein D6695_12165 [Planctomycetota bacterium]|nr:MAG: hypothetical protein D6695_12165 [Planctomycetota bacterium]